MVVTNDSDIELKICPKRGEIMAGCWKHRQLLSASEAIDLGEESSTTTLQKHRNP